MSATQPSAPLELQGFFPDHATLMAAFNQLSDAGFSRDDLSPPSEHPHFGEQASAEPTDNTAGGTDRAQLRTLGTGMAGYAGAAAVAGATIATGGAAVVAVAAAAAVGAGSAAAAASMGQAAERASHEQMDELAAEGRLVLGVRTANQAAADRATQILRSAGATDVKPVSTAKDATTAGVSSATWTG